MDPNEALLESWMLSLHDKAPGTRGLYLRSVRGFIRWLYDNDRPAGAPGDLLAVRRQDAEAWFGHQRAAGLAAATTRARWISLRSLYGWLNEEEEITDNPMARVKVAQPAPSPVRVIEPDQLRALLKACAGPAFIDRRDTAMVRTLAATGLRLGELTDLSTADIDLQRRIIHVRHGKGDRARYVRVDAATASALDRYKRARGRHRHAALPGFWLTRGGRLSPHSIPKLLQRRADRAGIGHIHPHLFRHFFAHSFLSAGGGEGDLQRLGGWENQAVMSRYGSARAVDRALANYDAVDHMATY